MRMEGCTPSLRAVVSWKGSWGRRFAATRWAASERARAEHRGRSCMRCVAGGLLRPTAAAVDARLACSWHAAPTSHPGQSPLLPPSLAAVGAGGLFCQLVRPLPHDAARAAAPGAGAARPAGGGQGKTMLWSCHAVVMLWSCCGHPLSLATSLWASEEEYLLHLSLHARFMRRWTASRRPPTRPWPRQAASAHSPRSICTGALLRRCAVLHSDALPSSRPAYAKVA